MHNDNFIKRCIDNRAYEPKNPEQKYFISHIDDVIDSLINLTGLKIEETTLGQIYKEFTSGKRSLSKNE
jgi:hypothetical protein